MRGTDTKNMIHSFKLKIAGIFFVFVTLILAVFGVVLYREFKEELMREMQESMQNRLENVSYNLEMLYEPVKINATMLSLDKDVIRIVQKGQNLSDYEYLKQTLEVKRKLSDFFNTHEILKSIYLISTEAEVFLRTDMQYTYDFQELSNQRWVGEIQGIEKNQYLRLSEDTMTEKHPEATLSYVVPIKNVPGSKIVGYLCANVGCDTIDEYFSNNKIGKEGEFLVFDDDQIIYESDSDEEFASKIRKAVPFEKESGQMILEDFLISYKWSKEMDWMYAAKIPLWEVTRPSMQIGRLPLILGILSVPVIGLCALLLSYAFFSPINVLVKNMSLVGEGNYVKIEQRRKDEFGLVFRDFNRMTDKIFSLMDKLCQQESLTKELVIKNLQAQLSPHFLYNTLDAIHWAARANDMEAVSDMTFLLSKYFRKNLSNGNDWVSVSEVYEMVSSYMDIQSLRFMDGFSYTMHMDPEIAEKEVPKSLFQPIVENALYHGIERSSHEGLCVIEWKKVEDKIRFYVKDNGRGMSENELSGLLRSIEEEQSRTSENFALRNIQKQLKLYYGEKIYIESELGKGTEVYFFLAIDKGGNHV